MMWKPQFLGNLDPRGPKVCEDRADLWLVENNGLAHLLAGGDCVCATKQMQLCMGNVPLCVKSVLASASPQGKVWGSWGFLQVKEHPFLGLGLQPSSDGVDVTADFDGVRKSPSIPLVHKTDMGRTNFTADSHFWRELSFSVPLAAQTLDLQISVVNKGGY